MIGRSIPKPNNPDALAVCDATVGVGTIIARDGTYFALDAADALRQRVQDEAAGGARTSQAGGVTTGAAVNTAIAVPSDRAVIRAELTGGDTPTALGISVSTCAAVIGLCRALVAAGHNLATRREAYCGPLLALLVRKIGKADGLEINAKGWRAARRCPPMRQRRQAYPGRTGAEP
jgi:hypothetical protein